MLVWRKVNKAEAEEFSKKLNLKHIEVSAKTGKRVNELFDGVLESIIKAQEENFLEPNTTRENFNQKEKKESVRKEKIELERTKKSAGQKVRDKCCPEGWVLFSYFISQFSVYKIILYSEGCKAKPLMALLQQRRVWTTKAFLAMLYWILKNKVIDLE